MTLSGTRPGNPSDCQQPHRGRLLPEGSDDSR